MERAFSTFYRIWYLCWPLNYPLLHDQHPDHWWNRVLRIGWFPQHPATSVPMGYGIKQEPISIERVYNSQLDNHQGSRNYLAYGLVVTKPQRLPHWELCDFLMVSCYNVSHLPNSTFSSIPMSSLVMSNNFMNWDWYCMVRNDFN